MSSEPSDDGQRLREKLAELKQLHEDGLIDADEYKAMKERALAAREPQSPAAVVVAVDEDENPHHILARWSPVQSLRLLGAPASWDWLTPSRNRGRVEYPLRGWPAHLEPMGLGAKVAPLPCFWVHGILSSLCCLWCMSCEILGGAGEEPPPDVFANRHADVKQRRLLAERALASSLLPGETLVWHGVPRRARYQSEALRLPNMPALEDMPFCGCYARDLTSSGGSGFLGYPEFAFGVTNARVIVAAFDLKKSDALGGRKLRSTVIFSMSLLDAENVRVQDAHHVFFGPENAGPGPIPRPECPALAGSPTAHGACLCAPFLTCNAHKFTPARVPEHAQALATHGVGFFDLEEADAAAAVAAIRVHAATAGEADLALPESPVLLDGSSNPAAPDSEGPVEEALTAELLEQLTAMEVAGAGPAPTGGAVVTPVGLPVGVPVGEEMDRGVEVELAAPVDVGAV